MLRSLVRSRSTRAAIPLTTRPPVATTTTMPACTCSGWPRRWMLSTTMSTVTAAMRTALARAARMVARWFPNERAGAGGAQGQADRHQGQHQGADVGRLCPASATRPVEWATIPTTTRATTSPSVEGEADGQSAGSVHGLLLGPAYRPVRACRLRRGPTPLLGSMSAHGGTRALPAPVPSDPRERRLVGHRLHRVGQRHPGPPPVPGPRPAPPARRPRLHRPAGARDPRRPGRPGPAPRRHRLLLLALLVRRAPPARAAASTRWWPRAARTSRSARPGPTRRGPASGTGPPTGS